MMKINKETHESLEDVLALLLEEFPGANIKKPLLSKSMIFVPYENFEFILRDKKSYLAVDFMLPVAQRSSAAVLFGAWGLLIWKAVFKSRRKEKFNDFISRAELAINKIGTIDSIGQDVK